MVAGAARHVIVSSGSDFVRLDFRYCIVLHSIVKMQCDIKLRIIIVIVNRSILLHWHFVTANRGRARVTRVKLVSPCHLCDAVGCNVRARLRKFNSQDVYVVHHRPVSPVQPPSSPATANK